MNTHVDHHQVLLDDNLQFCKKAKELIRRYKTCFEVMEEVLVERLTYVKSL